ncbi:MAG: cytochrome c biogenesis protein CcsA [Thermodesulfobacteriota bacteirum]|nr:cytochrome c biogenesis protein CcsA [Thermodesulfobacteriota bacterium]
MIATVPALFFLSFLSCAYYMFSGKLKFSRASNYLFLSSVIIQFLLFITGKVEIPPRNIEVTLFMTAAILSVFIYFFIRPNIKNLYSFFISPVAFIITLPLLLVSEQTNDFTLGNRILISHIILNLLAHTILFVSLILSSMFLYQHRNFKKKRINKISRLPSLSLIEKVNFSMIIASFPFMTAGFALGFILSKNQIGEYWFGTVSSISMITWLVYFLLIQLKLIYNLSGLKISYASIFGFFVIILGYLFMYFLELPSHSFLY